MKKRLAGAFLALVMVLSLLPVSALAAETGGESATGPVTYGGQTYSTLADAVAEIHKDTGTDRMQEHLITLTDNVTCAGFAVGYQSLTPNEGGFATTSGNNPINITIDLGGYTYTVSNSPTVGSGGTESNTFQFLQNSKVMIKNGSITSETANFLFQNYCDLTLENVNVTATKASYVVSNNCGNILFSGSTSITAGAGNVAFDVCDYTSYPGVTVTVDTTGSITGEIEISKSGNKISNEHLYIKNGDFDVTFDVQDTSAGYTPVQITGGTFSSDVSDYVVPGMAWDPETGNIIINTETAVASVDGVGYTSLSGAIAAAGTGDTVTVLQPVTEDVTVAAGKDVVLDLNGQTLTNNSGHTITVKSGATLTVKGNGTVDNVTHAKAAIWNEGTVVLNGGTYTRSKENGSSSENSGGNSYYVLLNHGTMTVNDGVQVTQDGHYSSLVENGYYNYGSNNSSSGYVSGVNAQYPSLTINGGTFDGGLNTIKNDDGGSLIINNGTFNNVSQAALLNWNATTINGGTFTSEAYCILNGGGDESIDKGDLVIKGGTFTAGEGHAAIAAMNDTSSYLNPTNIQISGGKFSSDVADFVVTGMEQDASGNVIINTETAVASVGGVGYTSLAKAITAAGTGDTVTLLKNLSLDGTLTLDKAITLTAADGVTVTAYTGGSSFVLSNGATLDGLTIGLAADDTSVNIIQMGTNSTVKNCVVTGQYQLGDNETSRAIEGIAGATGLTITGNTFKNLRQPAYINNCTGTISDNYVDATRGWVICSDSTMTITGNTFGENAVDIAIIANGGASNYTGEAASLSTANNGAYVQNQPALAEAEDGVLVVGRSNGYTLDKAFAEAKSGDTVKLEAPVTSATAITVPAGITLDGNGKAITCTATIANGAFLTAGGNNVTIKNVTIDTDGNVKHGVQFYCVDGGKLSGVTVNGGSYTSVIINGSTNITLENCTLNPDDGSYANVEYGMGSGVTTIPSVTVNNVTGDSDKALLYADQTTLDRITDVLGGGADNQDAIDTLKGSITNAGSSSITIDLPDSDVTVEPPHQGGGGGGGVSTPTYGSTVASTTNGSVTVSPKNASKDATVTITVAPSEGYMLNTITVTDKDGKTVELTKVSDTKYTFKMPGSAVTVKATFAEKPAESKLPFTDVAADAWYYDAVAYVYGNGMMTGTNDGTTFSPAMNLTRDMMAQVMYNIEKGTAPTTGTFTDVAAGAWYADAVNWAASKGIVNGYGDGTFGPEDSITREQMAVLLYNYAKYKGNDMTATADLSAFTDGSQVSDWAEYAMQWAVAEGLMNGSNNALNPLGTASRAEVAQILMNYFNK